MQPPLGKEACNKLCWVKDSKLYIRERKLSSEESYIIFINPYQRKYNDP